MRITLALLLALCLTLCACALAEGEPVIVPDEPADSAPEGEALLDEGTSISSDGSSETSGLCFERVTVVAQDPLTLRFEVKNEGERPVIGFWTLLYGTDAEGVTVYIHDDHGWWSDAAIEPGETGAAADAVLNEGVPAETLHTLILAAAYADGSEWELGNVDLDEAEALGLTAEWTLPQPDESGAAEPGQP